MKKKTYKKLWFEVDKLLYLSIRTYYD